MTASVDTNATATSGPATSGGGASSSGFNIGGINFGYQSQSAIPASNNAPASSPAASFVSASGGSKTLWLIVGGVAVLGIAVLLFKHHK